MSAALNAFEVQLVDQRVRVVLFTRVFAVFAFIRVIRG